MAPSGSARDLATLINQLQAERQQHVDAITQIDATFAQFGITPTPRKRRGRPPGRTAAAAPAPAKKRRKRGRFKISGDESVVSFVAKKGVATTAEINVHWAKEGRAGRADNALVKLIKDKKLKRENIKGERGSKYTVA